MAMTNSRKYRMTRLKAGDYLLPANDRSVLWRITRYVEDGSAEWVSVGSERKKIIGAFWSVWRYKRQFQQHEPVSTEWDDYEQLDSVLRSRSEAIDAAMKRRF